MRLMSLLGSSSLISFPLNPLTAISTVRRMLNRSLVLTNETAERLQEAIEHSSEDRDPGHGFEGNCYILLRITDVMYRCLKEDLIYFEICVDFTFLSQVVGAFGDPLRVSLFFFVWMCCHH